MILIALTKHMKIAKSHSDENVGSKGLGCQKSVFFFASAYFIV